MNPNFTNSTLMELIKLSAKENLYCENRQLNKTGSKNRFFRLCQTPADSEARLSLSGNTCANLELTKMPQTIPFKNVGLSCVTCTRKLEPAVARLN